MKQKRDDFAGGGLIQKKGGMIMCTNRKDFLKMTIVASLFVLFVPVSSFALVDTAEVSFDPDTSYITVPAGAEKKFLVDIVVDENADSLVQCDMRVRCDKNILAVDSVFRGSIWEGTGATIMGYFQIESNDSDQVHIVYGLLGWDEYAEGPGIIATVRFRTRGTGESDLIFENLTLTGFSQAVISSKSVNGKVYVQEPTDVEDFAEEINVIPGHSLSQNYPNPFNPNTHIDFNLAGACQVKLEVYNILGNKVKTLVNGKLGAGHKSITWDGKDEQGKELASGIYFYRLKADEFTLTNRMLLLK